MTGQEIDQAWKRLKLHDDSGARDQLIHHFAYLVKITSGRVMSNLPGSLDREDLVSSGAMGLIKAVDQFDPSRQVKFETYAIALIRGAILEMLRDEDWVPRSVRDRLKLLERAYMELEVQLGRPPTDDEVAVNLGLTQEEYNRLLMEAGRTSLVSMEDVLLGGEGGERLRLADVIHDEGAGPSLEAEMHERRRLLGLGIDRLPERERLVIAIYYYEGMTFKEISRILSISESRVYQLHTQAIIRLRGYLQQDTDLFG